MNRMIGILSVALALPAAGQEDATSPTGSAAIDSVRQDTTAGVMFSTGVPDVRPSPHEGPARTAARERSAARAADMGAGSNTAAGKGKKLSSGAKLSLDRATDKDGKKHWRRMNRKSTRQARNNPPGTVPVH